MFERSWRERKRGRKGREGERVGEREILAKAGRKRVKGVKHMQQDHRDLTTKIARRVKEIEERMCVSVEEQGEEEKEHTHTYTPVVRMTSA